MNRQHFSLPVLSFLFAFFCGTATLFADPIENGFASPTESTVPYVYWYWINNNIGKEGVTKDLEALVQAGVGGVMIGHIQDGGTPEGDTPILSEGWWDVVSHAVREGQRLGVRIGMFNGPGWSQSGGPWIQPEQSMRYLVSRETLLKPGESFDGILSVHEKAIQDVAVIAYPTPRFDRETPEITGVAIAPENEADAKRLLESPEKAQLRIQNGLSVEYSFKNKTLVQSFVFFFAGRDADASGEVLAQTDDEQFEKIGEFQFNNHGNPMPAMGPGRHEAYTFALKPTMTSKVKVVFRRAGNNVVAERLQIMSMALVDRGTEKQLGRMWGTPVPPPDGYLWPQQPENVPESSVKIDRLVDLTKQVDSKGRLQWTPPDSAVSWTIERIGMAPTGINNTPAPPQATGLEVDKMSDKHIVAHFDGMIGEFLRRIPAEERKFFERITIDSYEVGPQNWTDHFEEIFRERYGYDPIPWLPCVNGRIVESRDRTDRFLWDWRRLVADLIAERYVGGLRAIANKHGLKLWLENYGHWGFPGESLQYGAHADEIGGEYWQTADLGAVECRLAASSAHVYGKSRVSAEAFTSNSNFRHFPSDLKARGDWSLAQGINHFVLHVAVQEPYETPPGIVPWFGCDFNRNSTWFAEFGSGWIDYLRRCCFLLQQGTHVADVAYFFGEDAPRMNGEMDPPLPPGFDYDFINAEAILNRMSCRDGLWTLPDGKQYRILSIPRQVKKMRPELIEKIAALVKEGCVLLGSPPDGSPGMKDYPNCDKIVTDLAEELWGTQEEKTRQVGKGTVFRNISLEDAFRQLNLAPDVVCDNRSILWTHRHDAETSDDIYFVSNQSSGDVMIDPTFRVEGKQPELWNAVNGTKTKVAVYETVSQGTRVPLTLEPSGSIFIVFRKPSDRLASVVSLKKDGEDLLAKSGGVSDFTLLLHVEPSTEITLPNPTTRGVFMRGQNWIYFPEQGTHTWGEKNSGSGISIGSNGIVISEHWSDNFPPVLVWKAEKPLEKSVVAWVNRDGKASLYVNGVPMAEGVVTGQAVHFPRFVSQTFEGVVSRREFLKSALSSEEITEISGRWAKENKTDVSIFGPEPVLSRENGKYVLKNVRPGTYEAEFADGRKKTWTFSEKFKPYGMEMNENWNVDFHQRGGEIKQKTLDRLIDWRTSEEEFVKYFSGTAYYKKTFTVPDLREGNRVVLSLGNVSKICSITVDGKKAGILWQPPFEWDITEHVRSGQEHTLEIAVANSWLNRMIGDEQYPDDVANDANWKAGRWPEWFAGGTKRPEPRRITFSSKRQAGREDALHSSGLLGPVELRIVSDVVLE